jgi:DtxR family Mn-dependent transcriptional regulator
MEDYLKSAYLLRERGDEVSVHALASALGVSAPSVTGMMKRLATVGLVEHTPYRTISLTPAGEAVALEVVRHHRLLELYLSEFLGVPWDEVHAEADRLEHHISEDLEERIATRLGNPEADPHGDPIPARDGSMPPDGGVRLSALPVGASATVLRVPNGDPELLKYLRTLGLVPGAVVEVEARAPYDCVVTLRIRKSRQILGGTIAQQVHVHPTEDICEKVEPRVGMGAPA